MEHGHYFFLSGWNVRNGRLIYDTIRKLRFLMPSSTFVRKFALWSQSQQHIQISGAKQMLRVEYLLYGTYRIITLHAKVRQLAQLPEGQDFILWGWSGVGAKNIEKKMLFIIHLAEILYLSYPGTGSSSEPKLGYQERYHWGGDEARELLKEPTPWADECGSEWVSSGGCSLLSTRRDLCGLNQCV